MRKLKLQVQMTADGFVCGPNGELDWMSFNWDGKIMDYVNELTDSSDTIILGRKMTPGFMTYWTNVVSDKNNPEYPFGKKMIDTPKVVFTKTLGKSEWKNTKLSKGNLKDEIKNLKTQNGKDIIVYGGASFVSALIKQGLIDEFHLFVNPAVIGKGMKIFGDIEGKQNLKLIKSIPFDCGIVLLHYEPKGN
jgi:dihydrofolate reductase